MVGILLSYWGGLFSGATLVSGRVIYIGFHSHCVKNCRCVSTVCFETVVFFQAKMDAEHPGDVWDFLGARKEVKLMIHLPFKGNTALKETNIWVLNQK